MIKDTDNVHSILRAIKREFTRSDFARAKLKSQRVEKPRYKKDGTLSKNPEVFYCCEGCGKLFKDSEVEIDHIDPVVPVSIPTKHMDWNVLIEERCFVEDFSKLQVLCKQKGGCHKTKSSLENKKRVEWRKKEKHIVYMTTNSVNGKRYIGVHKCIDLDDGYLGSGDLLIKAVSKYGKKSFYRKVLYCFDNPKDAYDKERELVTEQVVKDDNFYNIKIGGFGFCKGRTFSKEVLDRMSKTRKGFDSPARKKAREEILHQIQKKQIIATNISTGEQFIFDSIASCSKELDLAGSCVSRVCRGSQNRRQHKGWTFESKTDKALPVLSENPNKGISAINKGGFSVTIKGKYIGYRRTFEEAKTLQQNYLNETKEKSND